jgi:hypothetical protein
MNNVCIALYGNTNTVHTYPTVTEMYNGNTNIVHTYPIVTVKCIMKIHTLFIHTLL